MAKLYNHNRNNLNIKISNHKNKVVLLIKIFNPNKMFKKIKIKYFNKIKINKMIDKI